MRVFLSYASEQAAEVAEVAVRLRARGYDVFWDQDKSALPPGLEYDERIKERVEQCDVFVFFISPESIAEGRYARTELGYAEDHWPNPSGKVLAVMASPTEMNDVPPYLRVGVTILTTRGDFALEVSNAVEELLPLQADKTERARRSARKRIAIGVGALAILGVLWAFWPPDPAGERGVLPTTTEPEPEPEAPACVDDELNPCVLVQGGEFRMGSPDEAGNKDERPRRRVTVSSFYMQEHEVTNEQYKLFEPSHPVWESTRKRPVVNVSWYQAKAYAESLGGRLPTEAQWEFAARGEEERTYPWGERLPGCDLASFDGWGFNYDDCGEGQLKPVGFHPAGKTPEGILDLAGNVWEWCQDWYAPYPDRDEKDPDGPLTGSNSNRVMRGGSFHHEAKQIRAANRGNHRPQEGYEYVGFRVVWPSP